MKFNDAITGAVMAALALFIGIYGQLLPPMPGQQYGAGAFPTLIAVGLGGFGLLLVFKAIRAREPGAAWIEIAPWARDPRTFGNFVLALALTLVYVFFSERVGFIPLGIAILLILFLRQGVPWRRAAVIAVAVTLVTQVAFANLMRVPLPRGILTEILW